MEFFDGLRPDSPEAKQLPLEERAPPRRPRRRGDHPDDLPGRRSSTPTCIRGTCWCCPAPRRGSSTSAWSGGSTTTSAARCSTTTTAWSPATPRTPRATSRRSAEPGPRRRPAGLPARGGGSLRPLEARRDVRRLLPRPADPGVGDPRGPVPDVLPGRDGADGQGADHLRGRGAGPAARVRRGGGVASATSAGSSSASSARCGWCRRNCGARRISSTR